MKIPRDLSGAALAELLCREYGYQRVHQVGSHIILETERPDIIE
jgi:predicted RNA binding protein YcfA (HicA-like mRNA interferase family)